MEKMAKGIPAIPSKKALTLCEIWYNWYNLKNVKNTYEGVLFFY